MLKKLLPIICIATLATAPVANAGFFSNAKAWAEAKVEQAREAREAREAAARKKAQQIADAARKVKEAAAAAAAKKAQQAQAIAEAARKKAEQLAEAALKAKEAAEALALEAAAQALALAESARALAEMANDVRELYPLIRHENRPDLLPGNIVPPSTDRETWAALDTTLAPELSNLIDLYADRSLRNTDGSWKEYNEGHAKKGVARTMLGKLAKAERLVEQNGGDLQDPEVVTLISDVNGYLLEAALEPWSGNGTMMDGTDILGVTIMQAEGDYDFTEVTLLSLLYQYGNKPQFLSTEAKDHLLNTLIISDGVAVRRDKVSAPASYGLVPETENHILKTEGDRYLKNQWLREVEGDNRLQYNNKLNGVEAFMLDFIDHTLKATMFEYNSVPYGESSLIALMNLEAYANDPVASKARELLDAIMFKYAIGSLDTYRSVPMRRKHTNVGNSYASDDSGSVAAANLFGRYNDTQSLNAIAYPSNHNPMNRTGAAFYATIVGYRVPNATLDLMQQKTDGYFVTLGRGYKTTPELYSAGSGYLLSAGGVIADSMEEYPVCKTLFDPEFQPACSDTVARATSLILSALPLKSRKDLFRMSGGNDIQSNGSIGEYWKYNNTCVYEDFACSAARVWIPEQNLLTENGITRICQNNAVSGTTTEENLDQWCVYSVPSTDTADALNIAIYSSNDLGVMALFPSADEQIIPSVLLADVIESNDNVQNLAGEFNWPQGGVISYDRHAANDKWAITSVDYDSGFDELGRDYERWSRINLVSGFMSLDIEVSNGAISDDSNLHIKARYDISDIIQFLSGSADGDYSKTFGDSVNTIVEP